MLSGPPDWTSTSSQGLETGVWGCTLCAAPATSAESPFAWNSDRDPLGFWEGGMTWPGSHPPSVLGEITLSLASLRQGLSS